VNSDNKRKDAFRHNAAVLSDYTQRNDVTWLTSELSNSAGRAGIIRLLHQWARHIGF